MRWRHICVVAGLLASGWGEVAGAQILNPVADTYVRQDIATSFGSEEFVKVKNSSSSSRYAYLKFDTPSVLGTITKASLELTVYSPDSWPQSTTVELREFTANGWDESTDWYSRPSDASMGSTLGSIALPVTETTWTVDITGYVESRRQAGSTTVSLTLRSSQKTNGGMFIFSRESAKPPQLVLESQQGPSPSAAPVSPDFDQDGIADLVVYRNGTWVFLQPGGGGEKPDQVAKPSFNPDGGTYTGSVTVAATTATSGATIRYTTDGSTPDASSSQFTAPLTLSQSTTLSAMAFKAGMDPSPVSSAIYTVRKETSGAGACWDPVNGHYWNHAYPRLANQHFGRSPAVWYALFDLVISKTDSNLIQGTKALDPCTKFLHTEGIIGPPPDKGSSITACPDWTDDLFARRDDGSVAQAGSPWAPRLADMTSLPQTPRNSRGERYNEFGPRCLSGLAVDGGYDGGGTDWVWHKPRAGNIDLDRNCVANGGSKDPAQGQACNDYEEHGAAWVDATYVAGVSDFIANWRLEIDQQFTDPNVPIWVNSGTLHDDNKIADVLLNSNGPEYEMKSGFRSFNYDWGQYKKWIEYGRKPTVWVSDIRPSGSDPYTYARGAHSKNYFELMRMMLAFTLLGDGYYEFQPIEAGEHKFYAYYDEFLAPLGYPTEVGQPGPHDDAHALANGTMVRFFDGGVAILNPNDSPTSVSDSDLAGLEGYAGPYWRFLGGQDPAHNSGQPFTSIILDGHTFTDQSVGDGIVLVRSPITLVADIIIDQMVHYTSPASDGAVLAPASSWTVSNGMGNSWSHSHAPWKDLYSYETTEDAGTTVDFRPTVGLAGEYEIFEWHPDVPNACTTVPAEIVINGQLKTSPVIDQSQGGARWNSLGTFSLNKGTGSSVKLTAPGGCTTVADAVKFVYR